MQDTARRVTESQSRFRRWDLNRKVLICDATGGLGKLVVQRRAEWFTTGTTQQRDVKAASARACASEEVNDDVIISWWDCDQVFHGPTREFRAREVGTLWVFAAHHGLSPVRPAEGGRVVFIKPIRLTWNVCRGMTRTRLAFARTVDELLRALLAYEVCVDPV